MKQRKGVVLVELVVVSFLIGICAVSIVLAISHGAVVAERSRHISQAARIASQQLEIIKAKPYNEVAIYLGPFTDDTEPVSDLPDSDTILEIRYYNEPINTLKQVTTTVNWRERNKARTLSFTTLISSHGVNP